MKNVIDTPAGQQTLHELKIEQIDKAHLNTSVGMVVLQRVRVPIMDESEGAVHDAWLVYAHQMRPGAQAYDEPLASTYIGSQNPEFGRRPPPADDPAVLTYLLAQLGKATTNAACRELGVTEPWNLSCPDLEMHAALQASLGVQMAIG